MSEKVYKVLLTEKEMQTLANACAAFYNVMNQNDELISPEQTVLLQGSLEKFKKAIESGTLQLVPPQIILPQ